MYVNITTVVLNTAYKLVVEEQYSLKQRFARLKIVGIEINSEYLLPL